MRGESSIQAKTRRLSRAKKIAVMAASAPSSIQDRSSTEGRASTRSARSTMPPRVLRLPSSPRCTSLCRHLLVVPEDPGKYPLVVFWKVDMEQLNSWAFKACKVLRSSEKTEEAVIGPAWDLVLRKGERLIKEPDKQGVYDLVESLGKDGKPLKHGSCDVSIMRHCFYNKEQTIQQIDAAVNILIPGKGVLGVCLHPQQLRNATGRSEELTERGVLSVKSWETYSLGGSKRDSNSDCICIIFLRNDMQAALPPAASATITRPGTTPARRRQWQTPTVRRAPGKSPTIEPCTTR